MENINTEEKEYRIPGFVPPSHSEGSERQFLSLRKPSVNYSLLRRTEVKIETEEGERRREKGETNGKESEG